MRRNLARHLKHIHHGRTSADDAVEFEIADQALLEYMNSVAAIELLGKIAKGFLQALPIDGLRQIIVGSMPDGFDGGFDGIETGHQQNVGAGILSQGTLEKFHPGHARHLQVGENDAALAGAHVFERLFGFGCWQTAIAEGSQHLAKHLQHGRVVIHNANIDQISRERVLGDFRLGGYIHGDTRANAVPEQKPAEAKAHGSQFTNEKTNLKV
jgi:hypothetical protein